MKPSLANFLRLAETMALEKTQFWEPADGMAMAVALKPEIVTESFETNLVPVLCGDARGAVMVDSKNTVHNARVIRDFNVTAFKNLILDCLS